ncbi:hypothetical protein F5Y11DRAFT_288743 [Daldinia sp. FL1419]|nr:hypothetical protein F5Y11DRAFT_288743 [Daldinia sp. FL1419]
MASNSPFNRIRSLSLFLLALLYNSVLRKPSIASSPICITLPLFDFLCVALSPAQLLFRPEYTTKKYDVIDVHHNPSNAVADLDQPHPP